MNAQDDEHAKIARTFRWPGGEPYGVATYHCANDSNCVDVHAHGSHDLVASAEWREEGGKVIRLKISICKGFWGQKPAALFNEAVFKEFLNGRKPEHIEYWIFSTDGRSERMEGLNATLSNEPIR